MVVTFTRDGHRRRRVGGGSKDFKVEAEMTMMVMMVKATERRRNAPTEWEDTRGRFVRPKKFACV